MNTNIIQMIGLIVTGIILIIFYSIQFNKSKRIIENAEESEGIIFDKQQDMMRDPTDPSAYQSYPIVRFLTKENKWITGESSVNISSIYFKKGQKIKVIYNRENPEEFIIKTWVSQQLLAYISLIGGIITLGYGLFLAFNYLKS